MNPFFIAEILEICRLWAMKHEKIIILDFGGQYAHLIASRIRRLGVLAEIMLPRDTKAADVAGDDVKGIILSGGPQSVFAVIALSAAQR